MFDEAGAVAELFAAVGTSVGFFTGVNPLVNDKVKLLAELFAALRAAIRLLACVSALVENQLRRLAEGFSALCAHMPCRAVRDLVLHEFIHVIEASLTMFALKLHLFLI